MHQLTSQGNSAPFLSLLGVSLASGSGLIAKEVEIESVCYEIRQAVSRTRLVQSQAHETESETHNWSLENFELECDVCVIGQLPVHLPLQLHGEPGGEHFRVTCLRVLLDISFSFEAFLFGALTVGVIMES